MNSPEMHLERAAAKQKAEVPCGMVGCGALFTPVRSWQKFCSDKCRNAYHSSMAPEAMRKDIDDLRRQLAEVRATLEQVNKDADRRDGVMSPT